MNTRNTNSIQCLADFSDEILCTIVLKLDNLGALRSLAMTCHRFRALLEKDAEPMRSLLRSLVRVSDIGIVYDLSNSSYTADCRVSQLPNGVRHGEETKIKWRTSAFGTPFDHYHVSIPWYCGVRHGVQVKKRLNGECVVTTTFVNGVRHGPKISRCAHTLIEFATNYVDGKYTSLIPSRVAFTASKLVRHSILQPCYCNESQTYMWQNVPHKYRVVARSVCGLATEIERYEVGRRDILFVGEMFRADQTLLCTKEVSSGVVVRELLRYRNGRPQVFIKGPIEVTHYPCGAVKTNSVILNKVDVTREVADALGLAPDERVVCSHIVQRYLASGDLHEISRHLLVYCSADSAPQLVVETRRLSAETGGVEQITYH